MPRVHGHALRRIAGVGTKPLFLRYGASALPYYYLNKKSASLNDFNIILGVQLALHCKLAVGA